MESNPNPSKSLWPVLLGLLFVMLVALGIGILLPDAVRGYDVEDLGRPAFDTKFERGLQDLQAQELNLVRKADYVTWKAFGHAECALLDMGDIRIAVPRIRTRGSKTWLGRLKIQTSAAPGEADDEKAYRVGGKRIWFESQWKDGVNHCEFCDLEFTIQGAKLHIADQVYDFGLGNRMLVVNREGRIEAGLRIAADGSLHTIPLN